MTETKRKYDSTIARIAGNLLSSYPFDEYDSDAQIRHIRNAVAMARGIIGEVEQTDDVATSGDTSRAVRTE